MLVTRARFLGEKGLRSALRRYFDFFEKSPAVGGSIHLGNLSQIESSLEAYLTRTRGFQVAKGRYWLVRCSEKLVRQTHFHEGIDAEQPRREGERMLLIILIVLLLVFGFGGYRLGPGIGYYGGGGISLIILIVIILLLLKVI